MSKAKTSGKVIDLMEALKESLRAAKLRECERTGHNFVLNRDGDGFCCSHGCGETRPRSAEGRNG